MLRKKFGANLTAGLLILSGCFLLKVNAVALNERVLYSFAGGVDGSDPNAPLISDKDGNLYGTTEMGGEFGFGNVFELVKSGTGWTHVILYNFTNNTDGGSPVGPIVFDQSGNIYGTTSTGGDYYKGEVYKLSPNQGDSWTLTLLYSFTGDTDGGYPYGGVILDNAGNLYGTADLGGSLSDCDGVGCGVVFELSPGSGGTWTETVIHDFTEVDGALPSSALVFDPRGNLYGTTSVGGTSPYCVGSPANGCGTLFELTPSSEGWTETTLHSFYLTNTDGCYPGGVTYHDGKIYGTTELGGRHQAGSVFEVAITTSGPIERVLHSFGAGTDATQPLGAVVFDKSGNLYGSASKGGNSECNNDGCGATFELTNGSWTETILYQFTGGNDGAFPSTTPSLRPSGNLFGTASGGGASNAGVVF
jgi:uncharacterized repeat protein (TIGR03803 family)